MNRRTLLALVVALPGLAACGGGGLDTLFSSGGGSSGSGGSGGGAPAAMTAAEKAYADEVLRLVNVERSKARVAPLVADTAAERAAYTHCVDMDARGYFDHFAPAPNASDPGQRLAAAGATNHGWAENIAMGYPTPTDVVAGWMGSATHRTNILNGGLNALGVGVRFGDGSIYWTQDFLAR